MSKTSCSWVLGCRNCVKNIAPFGRGERKITVGILHDGAHPRDKWSHVEEQKPIQNIDVPTRTNHATWKRKNRVEELTSLLQHSIWCKLFCSGFRELDKRVLVHGFRPNLFGLSAPVRVAPVSVQGLCVGGVKTNLERHGKPVSDTNYMECVTPFYTT